MTGLPDLNYPAFYEAAARWREAGWDVVNPADSFDGDAGRTYREYVESDLRALRSCDAIAMLDGWDGPNARGSVWEREIAVSIMGIPVYEAGFVVPTLAGKIGK